MYFTISDLRIRLLEEKLIVDSIFSLMTIYARPDKNIPLFTGFKNTPAIFAKIFNKL